MPYLLSALLVVRSRVCYSQSGGNDIGGSDTGGSDTGNIGLLYLLFALLVAPWLRRLHRGAL